MKLKTKTRIAGIHNLAKNLNQNLPRSEKWFHWFWRSNGFAHPSDRLNRPLIKKNKSGGYIPDIINHKFKFIIEVDGSIHETAAQIRKDERKDSYYKRRGYQIIRVKAYDEASAFLAAQLVTKIKNRYYAYQAYLGN